MVNLLKIAEGLFVTMTDPVTVGIGVKNSTATSTQELPLKDVRFVLANTDKIVGQTLEYECEHLYMRVLPGKNSVRILMDELGTCDFSLASLTRALNTVVFIQSAVTAAKLAK